MSELSEGQRTVTLLREVRLSVPSCVVRDYLYSAKRKTRFLSLNVWQGDGTSTGEMSADRT